MRFSIIVPVYNVEKYIDECVKSILNQSFRDFELVLVDDGSSDESGKICDRFSDKNANVIVLHKENGGLISARREGLKSAKGEYCLFCDSDDFLELDALEKINKVIEQRAPDIIIYNAFSYDGIKKTDFAEHPFNEGIVKDKKNLYETFMLSYSINSLCMKAVKREIIDIETDYSKYFRCPFGEDKLQSAPLLINAKTVYYLPERLYNYRYISGMMRKFNSKYYESYKTVNREITQLLESENIPDLNSLSAFNLLIAAYGGTTQFKYKKNYDKKELALIACDDDFIDAYKLIRDTNLYSKFDLKKKMILALLYHKRYGFIKMVLKGR